VNSSSSIIITNPSHSSAPNPSPTTNLLSLINLYDGNINCQKIQNHQKTLPRIVRRNLPCHQHQLWTITCHQTIKNRLQIPPNRPLSQNIHRPAQQLHCHWQRHSHSVLFRTRRRLQRPRNGLARAQSPRIAWKKWRHVLDQNLTDALYPNGQAYWVHSLARDFAQRHQAGEFSHGQRLKKVTRVCYRFRVK
jgi:hypothetical protein